MDELEHEFIQRIETTDQEREVWLHQQASWHDLQVELGRGSPYFRTDGIMRIKLCTCGRKAPRCAHCLKLGRMANRNLKERRKAGIALIQGDPLDIAKAERILAKKPPSSAITWLELSAGRSNS
jgi:hypothetical protein